MNLSIMSSCSYDPHGASSILFQVATLKSIDLDNQKTYEKMYGTTLAKRLPIARNWMQLVYIFTLYETSLGVLCHMF